MFRSLIGLVFLIAAGLYAVSWFDKHAVSLEEVFIGVDIAAPYAKTALPPSGSFTEQVTGESAPSIQRNPDGYRLSAARKG